MKTPQKITCFLLFAVLTLSSSGCCSRFFPSKIFGSREKVEEVSLDESKKNVEPQEAKIETILQIAGRARRIAPSPNSKRVLIERAPSFNEETSLGQETNALNSTSDAEDDLNVELWNLDFSTAEQEEFRANERSLVLQKSNCAAFSLQGDRLFWLGREPEYDESQGTENANSLFGAPSPSFELRNVVLTKELGSPSFPSKDESSVESTPKETVVKHLKTDDEIKRASRVRLSPNARWLIYRSLKNGSNAPEQSAKAPNSTPEDAKVEFLYDVPTWRLVYVPERKRVVSFPDTVKMTFDASTSDEKIEGRVVEILDVSDEGDLVATLVEELPQETQITEKKEAVSAGSTNWSPRYKIVIWDLQVARTVDLEKKRGAFCALEVSQIPLKIPVAPRDCHFSTDGKVLAAKVEPRSISVWQTANGRLKGEFWEDDGYIRDFALASNGMRLVAGVGNKEAELILWDVRTCVVQENFRFPGLKSIDAVTFFNSDADVLFVDSEGAVKRWNVDDALGYAAK